MIGGGVKPNWLNRIRIKYFQPNTNCVYLARKTWFLHSRGKFCKLYAKFLYLRIYHKYGCCIFPSAKVGKGFYIEHPVGIVIGNCTIGENFTIHQNTTIGVRHRFDDSKGLIPKIGSNVHLCSNAVILGDITITDNVTIGAGAIVLKDITEAGTYVGIPARRVYKNEGSGYC